MGAEISFKIVEKQAILPPPVGVQVYHKCSEVSPFKLYVDDIRNKYKLTFSVAKEDVADKIWTKSPQKKHYQNIAEGMKVNLRHKGWLIKQPVNELSLETCKVIEEILRKL